MMQRGWATAGKFLVAIAVLLVLVIGVPLILAIRNGVSAHTPPTAMEEMIARTARHFAIPLSARDMRNPVPLSAAAVAEGRGPCAGHCGVGPADGGSGDTEIGKGLYPEAHDMRTRDAPERHAGR